MTLSRISAIPLCSFLEIWFDVFALSNLLLNTLVFQYAVFKVHVFRSFAKITLFCSDQFPWDLIPLLPASPHPIGCLAKTFLFNGGIHLLSRAVSSKVPSAAYVLTIVFGMGTGVSHKRIDTTDFLLSKVTPFN